MRYRGIIHERLEDAPFVGALIIAEGCSLNCKGCFNQHLKESPIYENTPKEIVEMVVSNPFNHGIILGGLEWSEQPEDMLALIAWSTKYDLEVIVYTGLTQEEFESRFGKLYGCYVKYGGYDETKRGEKYYKGVKLATTNQGVIYYEFDDN
jgi:pyruvate-formate lyase-activating enzyme